MNPNSWTLTHYDRPWLMNKDKSLHWAKRHELIQEWKAAFKVLAMAEHMPKGIPRVFIKVTHFYTSKRPPDHGACMPASKAALDGIVAYGAIEDDSPTYVEELTYTWPQRSTRDALRLVITEVSTQPTIG